MSEPNLFIPTRARHDRFRLRSMLRQRKRRDEPRPTLISYSAEDPARPSPFTLLGGELDAAWLSAEYDWLPEAPGSTRHAFPFQQLNPEDGGSGTQPFQWDFVRNAQSLIAPIDPTSTDRGTLNARKAGGDLAARIWSVKTWKITGSYDGLTIDETFAAGNHLSVFIDDEGTTRVETTVGGNVGQRGFLPTSGTVWYNRGDFDQERASILISFEIPRADRFTAVDDTQVWSAWPRQIHAGKGPSSEPMILPPLQASVLWSSWNAENDPTAHGETHLSLLPTKADHDRGPIPIKLCGYQLTGFVKDNLLGGAIEPIEISADEFWGASEWPAP